MVGLPWLLFVTASEPGEGRAMDWFVTTLRENPELAIFLTLAIGFVLGRIRIGTLPPGERRRHAAGRGRWSASSTIPIAPVVKMVFFALFLFATGYKVGPQFFRGLKKAALPQLVLTVVLCVTSLVVAVIASKLMGYDVGTAAGLVAGAFTESTIIGTAGNTISRLDLPEDQKTALLNNIPVAYAVSYLVGTGFVVWFLSSLAPRLMKVDLKAESRKLEAESGLLAGPENGVQSAYREWVIRAFRLPDALAGCSVAEAEASFARPACSCSGFAAEASSSRRHPTSCCARATPWSWAPGARCCWPRGTASPRRSRTASCSISQSWPTTS